MVKINNMQRWGCVYRITNTVNSKKYIGQSVDFKSRMKNHKTKKLTSPISQAIQKYGWDAFKVEIIIDDVPEEDLENLEDSYIDVENTLVPNGYNIQKKGGNVSFNKQHQKWEAYGPKKKYIGHYFTKEKAEQALKLYKETGERLATDVTMRRRGTGNIEKRGNRWRARFKGKSKTLDTEEQCEEWLTFMKNDLSI